MVVAHDAGFRIFPGKCDQGSLVIGAAREVHHGLFGFPHEPDLLTAGGLFAAGELSHARQLLTGDQNAVVHGEEKKLHRYHLNPS